MGYLPIHLGTLRGGDIISFDIYIMLGSRHVHYIRKSDPFDSDRIENLRKKRVKKLYIPEEDEPHYLSYLDSGLDKAQDASISVENRSELISGALTTDAENAERAVQTEAGYRRTENRVAKVIDFFTSQASAMKNVLSAAGCAQDVFQHSANVVSLSLGLAGALGIKDPKALTDLGIAGLLHDIGLGKLGLTPQAEIDKLPVDVLTQYKQHPETGAMSLSDKPYVTPGVIELIKNHEEAGEGAGYPGKKRLNTLPLQQQVFNLCNAYDRFCTSKNIAPTEGMQAFFQARIGHFDLNHLKLLVSSLK